jgi:hypothetical protein
MWQYYIAPIVSAFKAESALLCGDLDAALPEFINSIERYPNDENILRGLVRARLTRIDNAEKFVKQLRLIVKKVQEYPDLLN